MAAPAGANAFGGFQRHARESPESCSVGPVRAPLPADLLSVCATCCTCENLFCRVNLLARPKGRQLIALTSRHHLDDWPALHPLPEGALGDFASARCSNTGAAPTGIGDEIPCAASAAGPLHHHAAVSTNDAAVFHARLDLDEPRRIQVIARGPSAQPQAANTVTATQWVVPGKHISGGDALLLEMPGFVVDVLSPPAHQKLTQSAVPVELRANVTMMCGCPIEPDGLWDANKFEVAAIVKMNGKQLATVPLKYAGDTSQFSGPLDVREPGAYEITVYAYDSANGNTGVDKTTFILQASQK